TNVVALAADLAVTKTGSAPAVAGGPPVTYTITATNNGPFDATNTVVSDTLPAGTTFVGIHAPLGWTCGHAGSTVTCTIGVLAANVTAGFTLTATVNSSTPPGTITNTVTVSSDNPDGDTTDNTAKWPTQVTTSADLGIVKTASPSGTVAPGGELTYTIVVHNYGPSDAVAAVSDTVPAQTTFQRFT